jgi:hypothetical protein
LLTNCSRIRSLTVQFRGLSRCRFCGRDNGSKELSDRVFSWPEGLPHYLQHHGVRLPDEFVAHATTGDRSWLALPTPAFDHLGQRDRSWPGPGAPHAQRGHQPGRRHSARRRLVAVAGTRRDRQPLTASAPRCPPGKRRELGRLGRDQT